MNNTIVVRPSKEEVEKYLKKWDSLEDYFLQESSLRKLFMETYPLNDDLDDVLVKVCTLNQFYSTNIRHIFTLSKHIVSLNIDKDLKDNNMDIVNRIASGHGIQIKDDAKESYLYSFATKYCSHHNPIMYPIYDSYVENMLKKCKEKDGFDIFSDKEMKSYSRFKDILINFRKFYDLESFDLRQIDKYLWLAGKNYFPKYYGKVVNEEQIPSSTKVE